MSTIESRIAELESRITKLESGTHKTSSGGGETDTLKPEMLEQAWADKDIAKLPSNWKGRSLDVIHRYSDLDAKEATDLAGFFSWKAEKGRNEVPVRMSNKLDKKTGQPVPWFESDLFTAKILRTWAKYGPNSTTKTNATGASRYGTSGHGASAKHAVTPEPSDADEDAGFPF